MTAPFKHLIIGSSHTFALGKAICCACLMARYQMTVGFGLKTHTPSPHSRDGLS